MSTATMEAGAAVREGPILMSGPMVRATLDGRKTQTRRVVKLRRGVTFENCAVETWDEAATRLRAMAPEPPDIAPFLLGKRTGGQHLACNLLDDVGIDRVYCPYGQPGDRLYVREAWQHLDGCDGEQTVYRATDAGPNGESAAGLGWRPSIHMPKWAARIWLEITDVRVERLQEITEEDAKAEGVDAVSLADVPRQATTSRRADFRQLWDALNAKRGYGWDVNPWVWVIGFRRVTS